MRHRFLLFPKPPPGTDAAAAFGISAAFPAFVTGTQEGGVDALPLLDQARSVLADIASRLHASSQASADPQYKVACDFFKRPHLYVKVTFHAVTASPGPQTTVMLSRAKWVTCTCLGADWRLFAACSISTLVRTIADLVPKVPQPRPDVDNLLGPGVA